MSPEVGDLVAWTANGRGIHLGIVYSHDRNGNPMVIRQSDNGKQMVVRVCALVLARKTGEDTYIEDDRIESAHAWWKFHDVVKNKEI